MVCTNLFSRYVLDAIFVVFRMSQYSQSRLWYREQAIRHEHSDDFSGSKSF